eukprot:2711817-Rhodomonas_salina.1
MPLPLPPPSPPSPRIGSFFFSPLLLLLLLQFPEATSANVRLGHVLQYGKLLYPRRYYYSLPTVLCMQYALFGTDMKYAPTNCPVLTP